MDEKTLIKLSLTFFILSLLLLTTLKHPQTEAILTHEDTSFYATIIDSTVREDGSTIIQVMQETQTQIYIRKPLYMNHTRVHIVGTKNNNMVFAKKITAVS
ncbi:MAG: hypothetical protein ACMXYF_00140 [Candidatus Woesearchaeota archaeon]